MPKELRISAVVTLPEGVFEEAEMLMKAQVLIAGLKHDFDEIAKISFEVVTPKPRGKRGAHGDDPA